MTPTFYREFKQLNRIAGISLHEKGLLYKVLPDPAEIPVLPIVASRKHWKLKAAISVGLMFWFWYEVSEYVLRMVR